MNKIVLVTLFLIVFNSIKAQDSLYSKKAVTTFQQNIKLNDSIKLRSFNLTAAQKKIYGRSVVNWDSIKNNPPQSVIAPENDASDANTAPVILPSPNSASLVNLISENVDLYTGKTSVNLPLYELKCGSISLPIALQGNVNAHKVNDKGTSVGLGMNLNAGGVITRVMKNLPDEFTGTICSDFNIPGWGYLQLKNGQGIDLVNFDSYSTQTKMDIIVRGNWNQKNSQPSVGWDVQPDEFYFNFGSYSGKFVFDQDGGINLLPQSNLKITPLFQVINGVNKISGFSVLTDNGVKYEFGNTSGGNYSTAPIEETKLSVNTSRIEYTYRAIAWDGNSSYVIQGGIPLYNSSIDHYAYEREPYLIGAVPFYWGNSPGTPSEACCLANFDQAQNNENTEFFSYPSSWMLKKITSPTGDFIDFNYSAATSFSYLTDRSFSSSMPDLPEDQLPPNMGGAVIFTSPAHPRWDNLRGIYTLPSNHFFTITKSTINLTTRKLASITTSDNSVVNFNHIILREDFLNDKRLDNIIILNSGNTTLKKFNFNYNIINTATGDLPDEQFKFFYHKTRYHYTGSNQATYLGMHSNFAMLNPQYIYAEENRGGANSPWAVPDEFRKRMFLTSVQEEANGVMIPAYGFTYNTTLKLPFRTAVDQDYFGFANSNPTRQPFVGSGTTSYFSYTYRNPYGTPPTLGAPNNFPNAPNSPYPILFFKTFTSSNTWTNPLYGGTKNYNLAIMQAGILNKISYPTGGFKEFVFDINVNGNATAWNGVRVSEIREYESVTAQPIVKNYSYGTFVHTDVPVVNHTMYEAAGQLPNLEIYYATDREFFSGNRVNPEALTRGSAGGYTYVDVSQPNNGRTRYEFYTALDPNRAEGPTSTFRVSNLTTNPVTVLGTIFPFPPNTSYDWKRGMPKKVTTYNNTGIGLPVKYEEFIYPPDVAFNGIKLIPNFSVTRYTIPNLPYTWFWDQRYFGRNYYLSTWNPPIKTITRIYDQNGGNYSENITEFDYRKYTYNSKDYLLSYQQKDLKDSRNLQTVSYSKFPFDYTSLNIFDPFQVAITNLKTKHVINAKIEQFSYKQDQNGNNKKYIGGILNKFHETKTLPKEIFKLRTTGQTGSFVESNTNTGWFAFDPNYKSEVNFPLYDANGRILEQHKTDDIQETYIWDYNKMYPVAKTVNARQTEVAFSSFEADEAASKINFTPGSVVENASIAFTGKKYYSLTNTISTNISVIINTTYKLSLWARGGDVFIQHFINGSYEFISIPTPLKTRADWNYYEITMPSNFNGIAAVSRRYSSDNVLADEIRLIPVQAQMNTYTFNPLIGMTSETDVNGKTVYYEYDGLNRLKFIKNEDKDIIKRICYNYANLVVPCN